MKSSLVPKGASPNPRVRVSGWVGFYVPPDTV